MSRDERMAATLEEILQGLTPSQREAVEQVEGPQLILAGPGSGKTRVVTHRIARMLWAGIPDHQILALTFTNKAADEMRLRVARLCPGQQVWMGTFHRFCSRQLRRYAPLVGLRENFTIYDADDSLKLLREAIHDAEVELIHETPARIAAAISWAKNDLIRPEEFRARRGQPLGALVERIYPRYQQRLLAANAVDFDDLLMHFALILRDNPDLRADLDARYRYIMVDEYQDTNIAQYVMVRAMSNTYPNLSVTGDPDQSIYGWRGATIRNILNFERDYPRVHVVRLEENFRSTQAILRAADQLISNNVKRKAKTLRTDNAEGRPVRLVTYSSGHQEADAIAARIANEVSAGQRRSRDYAIFYRTNALSRSLEQSLRSVGLPYQIVRGLEFYQRKEIKDVLAYLQLLNNPADDVAFLRIINTPPRKIGKTTVQRLVDYARDRQLPLLQAARQAGLIETIAKSTAVHVAAFVATLDAMHLIGGETVEEVVGRVFHYTGYRDWLDNAESEEDVQRVANLDELLSDAREYDLAHPGDGGLEAFLEQASLVADIDDWEIESDCVTMMTLHAAKGLEFPVAFIVGIENKRLPHERSHDDPDQLEEERRLLFVGMTRAKEELHLSSARERLIRGRQEHCAPSPFLMELPRDEMEVVGQIYYVSTGDYVPTDDYIPIEDWDTPAGTDDEYVYAGDAEFDEQLQQRLLSKIKTGSDLELEPDAANAPAEVRLVTAADLAGNSADQPRYSPEDFRQGMIVMHPDYGLGRIVSLGGSGSKRMASVEFGNDQGTHSFRLAHSPLRPMTK